MDVHGRAPRHFSAVAEELNVARATRTLLVPQSALIRPMRMLEKQLGANLFRRDTRPEDSTADHGGGNSAAARPRHADRLADRYESGPAP